MSGAPEIRLTAAWVARAMAGAIRSGDPAREFGGVSIDTRTVAPGELFVGVRGEQWDGAAFAAQAIERGAGGVVVPRGHQVAASPAVVIEVEDATRALQLLAREVRRKSGTKVVAITGSAGKTTTKEVTGEFLEAKYSVVRNRGNLNNHIGLPLSLMALRHRPEIAVVELGMNHAGEITTLVGIAEPDVRVWTNVGEAHLGFFASLDAIADAKAEIFEGATPATVLVANADDARVSARVPRFAGRVITFGIERDADVRATRVADRGIEGMSAHVSTGHGEFDLATPLVGRSNLANVLAATAVAVDCGVPLSAVAERARWLRPASHRGEVLRLADGVVVIDDSYNANPTATARALDVLAGATGSSRRIAVLGEMLELGEQSERLHSEVGRQAARGGIDLLVTVGGAPAAAMAASAVASGLASGAVRHFAESGEASEYVASAVRSGDLVLVKGSRGIHTDRIVEWLKTHGTGRG